MDLDYKKAFGVGILSQFIGVVSAILIYNYSSFQLSNSNYGLSLAIFFAPGIIIATGFSLYYYFTHKNAKDLSKLIFIVIVSVLSALLGAALFSIFAGWSLDHASFSNM